MLHGSQKRFDKDGDGKLSMREWNSWYYYAVGADEDARKRRAAYAAAEQKRAEIAEGFAAHAANIINWMYRNLAHLEGEREDQAIRTMHLALYVISAALQTQTVSDGLRYLLRAFWNAFQPSLKESVYQGLCAKQLIFEEIGVIRSDRLGSFWMELLYSLPPERRVGKDADLQELLDDTSRLYNYFRDDDTPEIDYAALIEPYWAKIRLPEESEEESDADEEEPDEDTESEEAELQPDVPEQNGYYTFCMVQFQDGGAPYAYLTGGISLKTGEFVIVPVGKYDKERLGRVTDVFVCTAQDAPYPPERTKFVLRKAEQAAFPAKKPAKKEAQPAPMQAAKKKPISTPPAAAKPKADTSKSAEPPVPTQPVAEKSKPEAPKTVPAPEPPKEKRRVPWGWLIAAAAVAAFVIFALPPIKRTAETQRQKVIALQAEQKAEREREAKRAEEQERIEEAKRAAETAAAREKSLKEQYSGKLPVDGMPVSGLPYTSLGAPTKTEKCQFYDNMDVHRRYKILHWYNSEGQVIASCHSHQPKGAAQEIIYAFTYYENPIGRPKSAAAWTLPSTSSSNSGSIRDDYDNPEDLYEDNPDWYDDEDEAWDEWENG